MLFIVEMDIDAPPNHKYETKGDVVKVKGRGKGSLRGKDREELLKRLRSKQQNFREKRTGVTYKKAKDMQKQMGLNSANKALDSLGLSQEKSNSVKQMIISRGKDDPELVNDIIKKII
jgi:Holliday junction resolvasome RuvABC DNA-binding subunit